MKTQMLFLVAGIVGLVASFGIGKYGKQFVHADFISGFLLGLSFSLFVMCLVKTLIVKLKK